ncbi:MAG: hypothetical protein HYT89_00980 [Candidatus Omnitrophica bacterium]|nr:hypothetical protein [Candidatus Omnitrophota bacterium]
MKSGRLVFFAAAAIFAVAAVFSFTGSPAAWANVKQVKIYKEAFPDEKPKCAHCHADEKPKKEDGQHELNEYGKKVLQAKTGETPDAEAYRKVGKE